MRDIECTSTGSLCLRTW